MISQSEHISICICTYKRPVMLERLLNSLQNQITENLFIYSIVIVDNDSQKTARNVVDTFKAGTSLTVNYFNEPEQNIALARNKAVANAGGDYIAFIDDDESAGNQWLVTLFKALKQYDVTGVLGSVKPHFESEPPQWIIKGEYFEKGSFKTGTVLHWENTRTSNALIKNVFKDKANLFNAEFGSGGEDRELFRRLMHKGHVFISCDKAAVYETIPIERCNKVFFIKRALLRGKVSLADSSSRYKNTMKSIVAVPLYMLMIPFCLILGQHIFMNYVIKTAEHGGRLLTLMRINVAKEKYVMCTDLQPQVIKGKAVEAKKLRGES